MGKVERREQDRPGTGWREDRIHAWLAQRGVSLAGITVGSQGHDAAVLGATSARTVVCCDQTIEGVHFTSDTSARAVGRKAAGRALSDLAATAATPRALLLALSAPASTGERWMREAIRGVDEHARRFDAALVGGDLAAADGPRSLSVTAIGDLAGRRTPPGRDRARAGDVVLITGPVGGSRARRHLRIEPRIAAGKWLFARGCTALMDVSDGLALDLSRIATASGVRIELESVPIHPDAQRAARESGRPARAHALFDGEDHELLATVRATRWRSLRGEAARLFPALQEIGRVRAGSGLWFAPDDGAPLERWSGSGGYLHGR